ncbi:methyl-accepting chemotaxis protein [Methylocapsa acidiphila]|uniref:methyl-accepting chemotaxis protein n=1 Tax=Methylocapsa acidiphila TaxID=133552 RepID=UPI0004055EE8|nr:methyl-accepting chemotaxis protein [Methylocapsa acidiphila]
MSLSNLSIIRKLGVGFACVLVAVAVMSATLFAVMRTLDSAAALNEKSYAVVDDLARAITAVSEQGRIARGYLITRDQHHVDGYNDAVQDFAASIAKARRDAAGYPEVLALLDKVDAAAVAWRTEYADAVIRLTRENATSDQGADLIKSARNAESLAAVQSAAKNARTQIDAWSAATQRDQDWFMGLARLSLVVGGLTTVGFAILVSWWMSRAIALPVTKMTETMNALAGGDASVVVPFVGRKDELGRMAAAVQTFKDAAIAKTRKQAEEAEAVKAWQKEDEERAAREAEEARQDQIAITGIGAGLRRLAEGDLVYRIETVFAPKTEMLRTDFNSAVEKLQRAMQAIHVNTHGIHSGSGEISSAADDLSRRTEQQAASLEETAATLDEITATVKNTAEGALHAQELVSSAKSDADQSGEIVRQAIAAMGGIEKSSQQIGQIIGVIDEIAFQTNLLALNAGVEAARAGDAGRGFAVVASEVRALAQRSAEAAKEIKSLISASTTQVGQGVDLVGETGKALGRIVAQVAEINSVVATIAASAQEQATALHQVNSAVNQMDQVTQQNAAMVEETTAAAHSLSQESEELARLLGRFQVGQEPAVAVEPIRIKPRPALAAKPVHRTLKAPARGGALRKLEAAPAEESWEEF